MVALRLLIPSGSFHDPLGQEGLAHLAAQLLLEGTAHRSSAQIHEAVEAMGGRLFVECSGDYTFLGLNILRQHLDGGLELLLEVLREPALPEEELVKKRSKIQGEIASQEDRPGGLAHRTFLDGLFGRGGYGHDPKGFRETLGRIGPEEVKAHYTNRIQRSEAVVVAVGDIEAEVFHDRVSRLLRGWGKPPSSSAGRNGSRELLPLESQRISISRPLSQTTVICGQETIPRGHPDVYAMWVMNYILGGGGFDSRLLEEIRSKRGLAYSVASGFDPGLHGGIFRVSFQTKNESAESATAIAMEETRKIQRKPVSAEELEGGKRFLIGSFPMRLDSNASVASSLALWELYGLGLDYPAIYADMVGAVNTTEISRVAREHLRPDRWVQVMVGGVPDVPV
jgi:zinc protease